MKQSEYPPAELRYGENLVAIEYFNFHKDDADAGNPYNTTFGMKVISGAFQGYASCEYDIKDFRIFLPPQRESIKDYRRITCEKGKYLAK